MNVRVVTISHQVGTSGPAIASEVASRLGFRLLDKEVVYQAAIEAGVSAELLRTAEHATSLWERVLTTLCLSPTNLGQAAYLAQSGELNLPFRTHEYRRLIDEFLARLPIQGEFVVLGHAGQAVLSERWDTLKVLIAGSKRLRTLAVCRELGLEPEQAAIFIDRSDRDHANYLREPPHNIDWLTPDLYDLCVNTDHVVLGRAVELICDEATSR